MITENTTLADIVRKHPAAASVFDQFDLDYCCGGKVSLREACPDDSKFRDVSLALDRTLAGPAACMAGPSLDDLPLPELIDYIVERHHGYVKGAMQPLYNHLQKAAGKHGQRHPELVEAFRLFAEIKTEMEAHMMKEEQILFPMIRQLALSTPADNLPLHPLQRGIPRKRLEAPIRVMLQEHESAGHKLHEIRMHTNHYNAPADACTTFRLCYDELKEFESDLHRHVHLENNILFPRAYALCDVQPNLN